MVRKRYLSRRLTVLMASACAVLAFSAVASAAAQAHEWRINGNPLGAGQSRTLNVTAAGPVEFSTEILGANLRITCSGEAGSGAKIVGGGTGGLTSITFSGCSMPSAPTCAIGSGKAHSITTTEVANDLVEVGSKVYEIFTPRNGTTFVTLKINGGCAWEGTYKISGSMAGYDPALGTNSNSHTLAFTPAIAEGAGAALLFEGKPMRFTSSMDLALPGGTEGWSGE